MIVFVFKFEFEFDSGDVAVVVVEVNWGDVFLAVVVADVVVAVMVPFLGVQEGLTLLVLLLVALTRVMHMHLLHACIRS